MTSKLTRDIIQSEIADFFAGVVEIHTELGGPNTVEEAQNQLTERVLGCVPAPETEREPIAWLNDAYLARGVVDGEAGSEDAGPGYIPVYREAGPHQAPVVSFYRDGIEASAKWIDQQREAYDSEHGWSDPDTGTFEFGNDAQREYSSTLEELAEGIRALHPNAGNSPVIPEWIPVSERMPENDGAYLCWDNRYVTTYAFIFGAWQANQFIAKNITHWMPLPAAPQEVKGE